MRNLCVTCHRIHNDNNWKYTLYKTEYGDRYGYFCSKWFKPSSPEWVPQRIKDQRQEFSKSLIQPYRQGVASQEYIDTYGTGRFHAADVKKAKNVWSKDLLKGGWEKSK